MYSLLSDDLCWLLICHALPNDFFLIRLFPCFVVLRVSVFYIANWLLFVWTCIRNHNLAACHFHNILYNWYISVIYLDICQKSQSSFLVSAKSQSLSYCVSDLSMYPMFQQIPYTSTIPPLHFALQNVCINNLS